MKTIYDRIKRTRFDSGLSQEDFAKTIGVHRGHVSNIENGKINPSDKLLNSICDHHAVRKEWLTDGTGAMRPRIEISEKDWESLEIQIIGIRYEDLIERIETVNNSLAHAKQQIIKGKDLWGGHIDMSMSDPLFAKVMAAWGEFNLKSTEFADLLQDIVGLDRIERKTWHEDPIDPMDLED